VEAELFHADGRTDIKELLVAFRNFANAPKKRSLRGTTAAYIITVAKGNEMVNSYDSQKMKKRRANVICLCFY
jgi:hypothetical protein